MVFNPAAMVIQPQMLITYIYDCYYQHNFLQVIVGPETYRVLTISNSYQLKLRFNVASDNSS